MDPISAFGLAASVVQLIDFTETLLSGTYEIYRSATTTGDTKINFNLMTVTTSLKTLNDDLQLSLRQVTSDSKTLSKHEVEIGKICEECSKVAEQLISKLEKLKVQKQHDLWESFRKALQTVWSKRELESLEKRLETFRMQISLQINTSLRYNATIL